MRWLTTLMLGVGLLGLPILVWGVEGGPARPAGDANPASYSKGAYLVSEFFLCDGRNGDPNDPTNTCADFDVITDGGGFPDYAVFHLITLTGCTGTPSAAIRGLDETGGESSDITTLTTTGTDQYIAQPVPNRIYNALVSSADDCTDIEILIKLYMEKKHQ